MLLSGLPASAGRLVVKPRSGQHAFRYYESPLNLAEHPMTLPGICGAAPDQELQELQEPAERRLFQPVHVTPFVSAPDQRQQLPQAEGTREKTTRFPVVVFSRSLSPHRRPDEGA